MKINSDKLMQNALIVFLDIQSIKKKNDLENGMDEFRRLVDSSGTRIIESIHIRQNRS